MLTANFHCNQKFLVKACLIGALTLTSVSSAPAAVTKIMPLGDSITVGSTATHGAGYRFPLWNLIEAGPLAGTIDFVGSEKKGPTSNFDRDHQGHRGHRIDELIDNPVEDWLTAATPDVILLHAGSVNAFFQNPNDPLDAVTTLNTLFDIIFTTLPNVEIAVAGIIGTAASPTNPFTLYIPPYNAEISGLVSAQQAQGNDISFVEMFNDSGMIYGLGSPDLVDTIHPSDSGYDKMAQVWYDHLLNILVNQQYVWDGNGVSPPSGNFGVAVNWDIDEVPVADSNVVFDSSENYDVMFDVDPASVDVIISSGQPTWISTGGTTQTYTISNDATIDAGALVVSDLNVDIGDDLGIGGLATMTVNSASAVSVAELLVGHSQGDGVLLVDGLATSLDISGAGVHIIGSDGDDGQLTYRNQASGMISGTLNVGVTNVGSSSGMLSVESDANLTVGNLNLGTGGATASGSVTLTGSGSSLAQTDASTLRLGTPGDSTGTLTVDAGATMTTGTGLTTIEATGVIDVIDGTYNANGDINIDGGTLAVNTSADFNMTAGQTVTITGGGLASFAGGYDIDVAADFEIQANGTLTVAELLASTGAGTVNLNGGTLNVGELDNSEGTLDFTAGALNITDASTSFVVGAAGLLGTNLVLGANRSITVAGTTLIEPLATLDAETFSSATVINNGSIVASGDNVVLGDATLFNAYSGTGNLDVGAHTVTLNDAGVAQLGGLTSISGGTLNAANGFSLGVGADLMGSGNVTGKIGFAFGSTIAATGDISLGDAAAAAGLIGDGELRTAEHTVTLHDANEAVLGSLTTLGTGGIAGTLNAANGLLVEPGKNVVGFGTVDTPNDVLKPLTNNGHIEGDAVAEPITLDGFVTGIGSFDKVNFTGTFSPGSSTAAINIGSAVYAATSRIILELGGLIPADEYDQLNFAGSVDLAGAVQVELVEGFVPIYGDNFQIMTFASSSGSFETYQGLFVDDDTTLVPQLSDVDLTLVAAISGDGNLDGVVNFSDFAILANQFNARGTTWSQGNFNLDGITNFDDFSILSAHFGSAVGSISVSAVPEPASLILLVAGLVFVGRIGAKP